MPLDPVACTEDILYQPPRPPRIHCGKTSSVSLPGADRFPHPDLLRKLQSLGILTGTAKRSSPQNPRLPKYLMSLSDLYSGFVSTGAPHGQEVPSRVRTSLTRPPSRNAAAARSVVYRPPHAARELPSYTSQLQSRQKPQLQHPRQRLYVFEPCPYRMISELPRMYLDADIAKPLAVREERAKTSFTTVGRWLLQQPGVSLDMQNPDTTIGSLLGYTIQKFAQHTQALIVPHDDRSGGKEDRRALAKHLLVHITPGRQQGREHVSCERQGHQAEPESFGRLSVWERVCGTGRAVVFDTVPPVKERFEASPSFQERRAGCGGRRGTGILRS
ncbi:hypothetical protein BU26DRAFT_503901 [Trematosphaeria pertusa]|uniref:Uncharacterized protein n=1 Tax=Trematosphaeria pertusa TaxID=390896 RepID=A0A6A6IMP7_9PLEO|nr:uncharacterized protein BU26DRAFT_503901 [Trematosphaeria pertusa]KAF2251378.1 hypothetical protein BU26DRAFT_503901 [Trematosphaeria pertusa]